ncbi:hypothetical protein PROFUN_11789 [Planoprotostelium fungivorum]|uniref:Uncharacterized protein n=1 Tax=Planoprotostelium fungivorum TaxID=1890364 RepID=A0A2P6N8P9_9EUKA|nr:hypothetical protein PROFUN_11789 [Planoprotostelium fungivorum]
MATFKEELTRRIIPLGDKVSTIQFLCISGSSRPGRVKVTERQRPITDMGQDRSKHSSVSRDKIADALTVRQPSPSNQSDKKRCSPSFSLLSSLLAASQADVFIVTTYNSSSCAFATESESHLTGCNGNGPVSSQGTISGNTATVKGYIGSGSCSQDAAQSTDTYTLGSVCTASASGGTYYEAYTGRTFTPVPGPNDQITENYLNSGCGGAGSTTIIYGQGCSTRGCAGVLIGSSRVVCVAQGQAYSAPSSSGFVVAFNFGLVAVAAVFTLF